MEHRNFPRRAFVTSDGVQLSYIRQGSGRPIVLLHGWSQCAEEFKHQIGPLSAQYDVIAVDQRSHGESQKVAYGLKISRLAKDLYELLSGLDLNEVALLGHSMGSSVIWCYIDVFGPERLSKIILVDQSPFLRRKWAKELDYWLIKELWAFRENRIAVRFAYEWHDEVGDSAVKEQVFYSH